MTACSAHRSNHMEEMITGQEIAERGQRKQSFCTGLSQSCPLQPPATSYPQSAFDTSLIKCSTESSLHLSPQSVYSSEFLMYVSAKDCNESGKV